MSLSFLRSPKPIHLFPLEDDLAAARVAGGTFRALQEDSWKGCDDIALRENAWVCPQDIETLKSAESGILQDSGGNVLARKGSPMAPIIPASEGSLLIHHSWDFLELNEQILKDITSGDQQGEIHHAANIDGQLITGPGTKILPGVYIEGTVVIGANCKIGPNCYIRGNSSIGDNCRVGQSVEIKNCIIGNNTNVGHLSYVGDSILGDDVNLGAGTTVANLRHDHSTHKTAIAGEMIDTGRKKFGTVIGNGVHTGIHTVIYPGRKLGPGTSTLPNQTVDQDIL